VYKILSRNTFLFSSDAEKYYNFTELACQLNEPEEGVAPTDSRLRPDQRLMEDGQWEEANTVKLRLEEKQRGVRRQREAEAEKAASEGKFRHLCQLLYSTLISLVIFCTLSLSPSLSLYNRHGMAK
jgi:Oxysterol-binding protein